MGTWIDQLKSHSLCGLEVPSGAGSSGLATGLGRETDSGQAAGGGAGQSTSFWPDSCLYSSGQRN